MKRKNKLISILILSLLILGIIGILGLSVKFFKDINFKEELDSRVNASRINFRNTLDTYTSGVTLIDDDISLIISNSSPEVSDFYIESECYFYNGGLLYASDSLNFFFGIDYFHSYSFNKIEIVYSKVNSLSLGSIRVGALNSLMIDSLEFNDIELTSKPSELKKEFEYDTIKNGIRLNGINNFIIYEINIWTKGD
jgi:hypothetical protein